MHRVICMILCVLQYHYSLQGSSCNVQGNLYDSLCVPCSKTEKKLQRVSLTQQAVLQHIHSV